MTKILITIGAIVASVLLTIAGHYFATNGHMFHGGFCIIASPICAAIGGYLVRDAL